MSCALISACIRSSEPDADAMPTQGGYGELKEQGGKWVFDREVLAANAAAHVRALSGRRK